jgi:hypothetical protein
MNLQELRFKTYGLGQLMKHIAGLIDSNAKMAEYLKLDATQPLTKVNMSLTRLVASHQFVAVQEDLVPTQRGPAIMNIALCQSTAIAHPKKHVAEFAAVQVHSYSSKPGDGAVGIPTSASLRVVWRDEPLQIYMATLHIEASQGEGDEVRTASKNIHYGADFILGKPEP